MKLAPGGAGNAKLLVKLDGPNVPGVPAAPPPPIRLQLANDLGECWEARFSVPLSVAPGSFKARSDPASPSGAFVARARLR